MRLVVEKRTVASRRFSVAVRVASVAAALLTMAAVFAGYGLDPVRVYGGIFSKAFGTPVGLAETVVRMIPLLLISSGLALVFKAQFWNIGAEGQFLAGAMAAFVVATSLPDLPPHLLIPLMFAVGFLAGAAWGVPTAFMRAKLNVNEVITTLMFTYILDWIFQWTLSGPWKARETVGQLTYSGFRHSVVITENAWLPLIEGTRVHWPTLALAVAAAIAAYLVVSRTTFGYELRVVGDNPEAARAAGMSYSTVVSVGMIISGGLAGMAGVGELAGIQHRFTAEFLTGYGYDAIITAWLGGMNPVGLLVANFLLGGLVVGGDYLQIKFRLPGGMIDMFNGTILFFVLAFEFLLRYRIRIRR